MFDIGIAASTRQISGLDDSTLIEDKIFGM
jgi:hypothetical protein